MMPGLDGIELCQGIRQQPRLAGMCVLLIDLDFFKRENAPQA